MSSPSKYMPITAAFDAVVGTRPHPSTLWRFYTKGSAGVVLKTWMLGGRRVTTIEAVKEFFDQRTAVGSPIVKLDDSKAAQELQSELA